MGGPGSTRWGRRRGPPRPLIDDALRLTSRQAVRSLRAGYRTALGEIRWETRRLWTGSGRIVRKGTLVPFTGLRTRRDEYRVFLAASDQPRGRGQRFWLACMGCGRVRKALYLWGARALRCRVCLGLSYPIERLTPRKRAAYRRAKIGRQIAYY
ncbi:MAG: hypothetical protein AB1762_17610, partial [Gemmatimonadota bacterium]